MKGVIKTIGKNSEKIGDTMVTGEGTHILIPNDEEVAVRDYIAGKGYDGLVQWDGESPSFAGHKIQPTQIKNGTSYALKNEIDGLIDDFEKSNGIKSNDEIMDNKYRKEADELIGQIVNRKEFSYEPEKDTVFQGYKNQYEAQAENALRRVLNDNNTSITGATGAILSDALAAYDSEMDKVSNIIPDLYEDAYNRYIKENSMLRDDFQMLYDIADSYYDDEYRAKSEMIDRANDAGQTERDERQRILENERNTTNDMYDNALKSIEIQYTGDKMQADIDKTRLSSESVAMDNAVERGFFIEADEAALPWLAKYRDEYGNYSINPAMAKLAYEYNAAHERERAKINAKLGR